MRAFRHGEILLLAVALVVLTLWIDFSRIHRFHNSDSLVMALISLHQWTPLFWEQDRLGMVFPLLALPWRHSLDNLLAQGAMTTFLGLASFFLLGYYVAGRKLGMAIGALGAIFLMVFCRLEQRFAYLIYVHHFATAASFALVGMIVLDRWAHGRSAMWSILGVLLIAVAHWINPGVAFAFGPLLLVRGMSFRGLGDYFDRLDAAQQAGTSEPSPPWADGYRPRLTKDEIVGLAAIVVSLAGSLVISRTTAEPLPYNFLSPSEWLACAVRVWLNLNEVFQHRWYRAVDVTALIGLATLYWPAGRQRARLSLRMAGGLLAAAAVQYAFMTSLDHVHRSHFGRYVALSVFFWQTALVGFTVMQVAAVLPTTVWARRIPVLLTLAMTALVAATHGWPSRSVVRAEIDATLGRYTDDLLASGCTHITGDYWHVWPAMFHANLRLEDAHSTRRVWGIADAAGRPRNSGARFHRPRCALARSSAMNRKASRFARITGCRRSPRWNSVARFACCGRSRPFEATRGSRLNGTNDQEA